MTKQRDAIDKTKTILTFPFFNKRFKLFVNSNRYEKMTKMLNDADIHAARAWEKYRTNRIEIK